MTTLNLICSNRPRPSVQKGAKGHAGWARDVFHARKSVIDVRTLCGVAAADWLTIEARQAADVLSDPHFCQWCAAKVS